MRFSQHQWNLEQATEAPGSKHHGKRIACVFCYPCNPAGLQLQVENTVSLTLHKYLSIIKGVTAEDCFQTLPHFTVHTGVCSYTATQPYTLIHSTVSKGPAADFLLLGTLLLLFFSDFSSVKSKIVYLRNRDPYCHFWQIREQHLNLWFHNEHKEFWFRQLPVLLNFRDYILLSLFSSTLKIKFGKAHAAVAGIVLALHCETECYPLVSVASNQKIPRINLKDCQQVWFKSKIWQYKRK